MAVFYPRCNAGLLLLLALAAVARVSGRPSTTSQPEEEEVTTPFNLTVHSYNFNTVLYWNYSRTTLAPYFQVEKKDKVNRAWTSIENCRNILNNYCRLLFITDPFDYYKVRVKALVGHQESNYASTEFTLTDIGILGPPTLNTSIIEKAILIDIWHPHIDAKNIVKYEDIEYKVYFRNTTQRTIYCDDQACSIEFPILDTEDHCFSAEGLLQDLPIKWEMSKETCIALPEEQKPVISNESAEIAIYIIIPIVVVILVVIITFLLLTKARAIMPQSLNSVVSRFNIQPQQSTGYDAVSTYPIESPVEEVSCLKEDLKKDTDVSHESVSNGSTDPGYKTDNGQKAEEKDGESSSSGYFHADSSSSDSNCQGSPEPDKDQNTAKEEPEPSRDLKPMTNSFGYDKPHCPM